MKDNDDGPEGISIDADNVDGKVPKLPKPKLKGKPLFIVLLPFDGPLVVRVLPLIFHVDDDTDGEVTKFVVDKVVGKPPKIFVEVVFSFGRGGGIVLKLLLLLDTVLLVYAEGG